jgi:hypothetical protein
MCVIATRDAHTRTQAGSSPTSLVRLRRFGESAHAATDAQRALRRCVELFREPISYALPDVVPQVRELVCD